MTVRNSADTEEGLPPLPVGILPPDREMRFISTRTSTGVVDTRVAYYMYTCDLTYRQAIAYVLYRQGYMQQSIADHMQIGVVPVSKYIRSARSKIRASDIEEAKE